METIVKPGLEPENRSWNRKPAATPCSADILVCGFTGHSCPVFLETGDWKVARTRRLESLRYASQWGVRFGVRVESTGRRRTS